MPPVGADRLHAQAEFLGRLGHRLARGDEKHDLVLPVRELLVGGLVHVAVQEVGELLGQGLGDVAASLGDLADGRDELLGRAGLGEIARGTVPKGPHRILLLGVDAQDHDGQVRLLALELLEDLEPAAARHGDVQQDEIEVLLLDQVQDLLPVAGLAGHIHVGLTHEDLLVPLADDGVIIGDQDSNLFHGPSLSP